jgi:hypothetical protein
MLDFKKGRTRIMALEAVGELLEFVGRIVFKFLNEAFVEILCKGTGHILCKPFNKNVDPDGALVFCVGFVFWICVVLLGFDLYEFIQIDKCLDAGGRVEPSTTNCIK